MNKELLFSVTSKDCEFQYSRGSGKGGQKRNKTSSKVRCVHKESGAEGISDDTRSQHQNKVTAFRRMFDSDVFQKWHRLECARRLGVIAQVEEEVDRQMKNIKVEGKDENGKWTKI